MRKSINFIEMNKRTNARFRHLTNSYIMEQIHLPGKQLCICG